MRFSLRLALGLLLFTSFPFLDGISFGDEGAFELKDKDRVVFLGSEFTEQDIKHNYFEAALTARWPERRIIFRNLGWAGDRPNAVARGYFGGAEEGYRRLIEELNRLQPTVIFVFYGENSAYGSDPALATFESQMKTLLGDLRKHTSRIVLVSPRPAEKLPDPLPEPKQTNQNRQAVATMLRKLATENGFRYLDLFEPMRTVLAETEKPLTTDTIRFTDTGYALAADAMLEGLQVRSMSPQGRDARLRELIAEKNELYFHRYRPQNETYLRGFRKHEQGQNAKEISEFDPLIERAEARIAAFVQGQPLPPAIEEPPPKELDFIALTPEEQQAQFTLDPEISIEPFAWEPMIANPINMNFDSRGRLWIASSPIYPQIRPGARPHDTIIILEDTDGDHRADQRTVFAEGLLIPTAVLPDERGGAYVANSTELLYLRDTDGDGRADERQVLLSGFGTEDTHHILHTFRWSPDSLLSFNQSIYIHTQAETPYGVETCLGSGIWRYRKQTARARTVAYGLINPWGLVFDQWGQSFATDGAGGNGINYIFPGAAYETAVGYDRVLKGMNPGQPKHCGLEIISGRHFSENWRGTLVAADFRGNRINRFQLAEQGSGYTSRQLDDLLSCRDRAFRPVDLKMAPDGSLFIADWHNPIINHGEVDFRDPRRDDRHGRIWRITMKNRPPVPAPNPAEASIGELFDLLKAPEQWTRQMARVQLSLHQADQVFTALGRWVEAIDTANPDRERLRLEALWVGQSIGRVPANLLNELLNSNDHHARAAAVRVLSQSTSENYGLPADMPVLPQLEKAVADEHPQVRLEAVNALRGIESAEAAEIALKALDRDMDQYLDFALWRTVRQLEAQWMPELLSGKAGFASQINKVLFALQAVDNASAIPPLMTLLSENRIPEDRLPEVLDLISKFGGPSEARVLFDRAIANPSQRPLFLNALLKAAATRKVIPTGDLSPLETMLGDPKALQLSGYWKMKSLQPRLIAIATDRKQPGQLRRGAVDGLAAFGDRTTLNAMATDSEYPKDMQRLAIDGMTKLDVPQACRLAAEFLSKAEDQDEKEVIAVMDLILGQKNGPTHLANALKNHQIRPQLATIATRRASSAGKRADALVNALRQAGGLHQVSKEMTPEELSALLAQVKDSGDPVRGENVFRRRDLACLTCHSIGGAGGQAGPDMLSLGASSPVDYIVQSLLNPSAKIKEGYHTVLVSTVEGKVVNGVLVREGEDELVLRDAQNKEVAIPKKDIDERVISPTSLMPADLTSKLPRDEFVDLVSFLSNLGKEGPFKVPAKPLIRRWIAADGQVLLSRVDGTLPIADIPGRSVSFEIDVTSPGQIGLELNDPQGLRVTRGAQEDNLRAKRIVVDLPAGRHQFSIAIQGRRTEPLRIEIVDIEGSKGHAEPVNR
jgi:putative heme-binding domain-containing protein